MDQHPQVWVEMHPESEPYLREEATPLEEGASTPGLALWSTEKNTECRLEMGSTEPEFYESWAAEFLATEVARKAVFGSIDREALARIILEPQCVDGAWIEPADAILAWLNRSEQ
jgi:hypothetical protein